MQVAVISPGFKGWIVAKAAFAAKPWCQPQPTPEGIAQRRLLFERRQLGGGGEIKIKHPGKHALIAQLGPAAVQRDGGVQPMRQRAGGSILKHLVAETTVQTGCDHGGFLIRWQAIGRLFSIECF